jgi:hypothetical protein
MSRRYYTAIEVIFRQFDYLLDDAIGERSDPSPACTRPAQTYRFCRFASYEGKAICSEMIPAADYLYFVELGLWSDSTTRAPIPSRKIKCTPGVFAHPIDARTGFWPYSLVIQKHSTNSPEALSGRLCCQRHNWRRIIIHLIYQIREVMDCLGHTAQIKIRYIIPGQGWWLIWKSTSGNSLNTAQEIQCRIVVNPFIPVKPG